MFEKFGQSRQNPDCRLSARRCDRRAAAVTARPQQFRIVLINAIYHDAQKYTAGRLTWYGSVTEVDGMVTAVATREPTQYLGHVR